MDSTTLVNPVIDDDHVLAEGLPDRDELRSNALANLDQLRGNDCVADYDPVSAANPLARSAFDSHDEESDFSPTALAFMTALHDHLATLAEIEQPGASGTRFLDDVDRSGLPSSWMPGIAHVDTVASRRRFIDPTGSALDADRWASDDLRDVLARQTWEDATDRGVDRPWHASLDGELVVEQNRAADAMTLIAACEPHEVAALAGVAEGLEIEPADRARAAHAVLDDPDHAAAVLDAPWIPGVFREPLLEPAPREGYLSRQMTERDRAHYAALRKAKARRYASRSGRPRPGASKRVRWAPGYPRPASAPALPPEPVSRRLPPQTGVWDAVRRETDAYAPREYLYTYLARSGRVREERWLRRDPRRPVITDRRDRFVRYGQSRWQWTGEWRYADHREYLNS